MRNVRRYDAQGAPVFITIVCRDHLPLLRNPGTKDALLACLKQLHSTGSFKLYAWVILDDHLHLLLGDCKPDFSTVVGIFKQRGMLRLRQSALWQPRFFDHLIRDDKDLQAHVDYIHFNPRKHGLVGVPSDYGWSSLPRFIAKGTFPEQWGAETEPSSIGDGIGSE